VKDSCPRPLAGSERGRRKKRRAAAQATAQVQLRSKASAIEVDGTAKSSTTFVSESYWEQLHNGLTKDHYTYCDDSSKSVRQVDKTKFRSRISYRCQ